MTETETIYAQFEDGKLHPDSAAAAAIKGLPAGELANKLEYFEAQYELFMYSKAGQRTFRSRLAWWIGGAGMRATRSEVVLLAQTIQPMLLEPRREAAAANFGAEYQRVCEQLREFRSFLKRHFEMEMEKAEDLNTPLLDVARELLLRSRS